MNIALDNLSIEVLFSFFQSKKKIVLNIENIQRINDSYNYLKNKIEQLDKPIYGVNTGFGSLCQTVISKENLSDLQLNLLRSHAAGQGKSLNKELSRLMLLLKIRNLCLGYSGVSLELIERLIFLYNNNIIPVVYEYGSLGASGDLAPLAHLSLPLLNEGEVWINDSIVQNYKAFETPLKLKAKEGLALINGTQFMLALGLYALQDAKNLLVKSIEVAAFSIEAYLCRPEPFMKYSHQIRKHKGQMWVAETIEKLLADSLLVHSESRVVQDPYSFRCIPQVLGAAYGVLQQVVDVFQVELNSVTDNPNVFAAEDKILSAGNFHGQALAFALDYLSLALCEIGSISERRTYKFQAGERNLPIYLTKNGGLNSGLMIAQYTAASLVSANKQLATPASIDNIESSNGQEDHVSMGANAALKNLKIIENLKSIIAIEFLCASRALLYRDQSQFSQHAKTNLAQFERIHPQTETDQFMKPQIDAARLYLFDF